jgi:hypothetical protein
MTPVQDAQTVEWIRPVAATTLSSLAGALSGVIIAGIFHEPGAALESIFAGAVVGGLGTATGSIVGIIVHKSFTDTKCSRIFKGLVGGVGFSALLLSVGQVSAYKTQSTPLEYGIIAAIPAVIGAAGCALADHKSGSFAAGLAATLGIASATGLGLGYAFTQFFFPTLGKQAAIYTFATWQSTLGYIFGSDALKRE